MFFRLLKEGVMFAVNSVMVNKFRTFLSLFGITIGIFSFISVFTVLDWLEKSIQDSVNSMGSNVLYIQKFPWSFDPNLAWWDIIKWPAISQADQQAVLSKSTKAEAVSFLASRGGTIKYKNNSAEEIGIAAVTDNLDKVVNFEIEKGRYFSSTDYASGTNVAVLGAELAERLFEKGNPVGKEISVAGFKATVIGVLKREGQGGIKLNDIDDLTLVPLNFGKSFINLRNRFSNSQMMIKAKPGVNREELADEITMIIRNNRRLKPTEPTNFSVNTPTMLSQGFKGVFSMINFGGMLISILSIVVGGFGIANIMFVSVRERTNQIGIQKALGAKKAFILEQFLVESVILSIIGGMLGLLLIFLGTVVVNYLYELNMYLTTGNIIKALLISGTIGVVAGYAPAVSAARMDPVEAIGYSFG
jgi:putative ABC transport system permease protein